MLYVMKIALLSETVIGSGVSVPGSVDNDIIYNDLGLPYIKGKTLKGNLREVYENVLEWLKLDNENCYRMFGCEGIFNPDYSVLNISDATFSETISMAIKEAIDEKTIYLQEIKYALTNERYFTQIEDGIAKDHSLRSIRTIEPGIEFYADIRCNRVLTEEEEGILAATVNMVKNIGLMRSRGKGAVKCSLYKDGKDITSASLDLLERRLGQ